MTQPLATGIGGVFMKAEDPAAQMDWYEQHLGLAPRGEGPNFDLVWREEEAPHAVGRTVFAFFPADTQYFAPSELPYMVNYRVRDLHAALDRLRAGGVEVDEKVEEFSYGKFGWIAGPDGERIELWEPPEESEEDAARFESDAGPTALGGWFFKGESVEATRQWYAEHLGIQPLPQDASRFPEGTIAFRWRPFHDPDRTAFTVWGPFPPDTGYFAPSSKPYMLNLRVDDLDGRLKALREAGIAVDDRVDEYPYGRFGWTMDPEGTRIELWEPAAGH